MNELVDAWQWYVGLSISEVCALAAMVGFLIAMYYLD